MEFSLAESAATDWAKQVVRHVFRDYPGGLAVRLWNGETLTGGKGPPDFTLVFHDPRPFRDLILFRDPLRLAEAYFRGLVDVEGDLYAVFALKDHLDSLALSFNERLAFLATALRLHGNSPTAPGSRTRRIGFPGGHARNTSESIAFHYDVSDDFYGLWLDERMVYSCAYFESPEDSLDQAQRNKLAHICRKLRLRPGERLLDIGCGWGALVMWAARNHGVHAHGITLSRNQYESARRRIAEEGLGDRVTVELKDYRDLDGEARFDKIVSVGMFEHVGLKNLPVYFGTAHRLLKPGGLFLNHGITHDSEGWRKTPATAFINRYVFPDGELDTVSNVQRATERAGFEILDVEALRPHYARTLRHWVKRLEGRREEALAHVPEATYRVWRLYMAACALEFEKGEVGVYQILASPRGPWPDTLPQTRRDVYD